jgi:hypothetical protein
MKNSNADCGMRNEKQEQHKAAHIAGYVMRISEWGMRNENLRTTESRKEPV